MKKLKTYWWFWGWIPIFLFFAFVYSDSQLDSPEEQWFKVFPLNNYGFPVAMVLFFSGFGYLFISQSERKNLVILHALTTIIGLLILSIPKVIFLSSPPRRYYSNTLEVTFFEFLIEMNTISLFGVFLIFFGVIIYFVHLGIAIFKNKS